MNPPIVQAGQPGVWFVTVLFVVVALAMLFLGAFAYALVRGHTIREFVSNRVTWGRFLIVFVVICLPTVRLAVPTSASLGSFDIWITFAIPNFMAGLSLEFHASRIIQKAPNNPSSPSASS